MITTNFTQMIYKKNSIVDFIISVSFSNWLILLKIPTDFSFIPKHNLFQNTVLNSLLNLQSKKKELKKALRTPKIFTYITIYILFLCTHIPLIIQQARLYLEILYSKYFKLIYIYKTKVLFFFLRDLIEFTKNQFCFVHIYLLSSKGLWNGRTFRNVLLALSTYIYLQHTFPRSHLIHSQENQRIQTEWVFTLMVCQQFIYAGF